MEADVTMGDSSEIEQEATIRAGSTLGNNVRVKKKAEVPPNTIVPDGCTYKADNTIDCP